MEISYLGELLELEQDNYIYIVVFSTGEDENSLLAVVHKRPFVHSLRPRLGNRQKILVQFQGKVAGGKKDPIEKMWNWATNNKIRCLKVISWKTILQILE